MFARLFNSLLAGALLLHVGAGAAPSARLVPAHQEGWADQDTVAAVRAAARPLTGASSDYDPLVDRAKNATRVLLGESTHGTREFQVDRSRLTLRLIREAGFNAIAIEGDWTPARRLDLFVRGLGSDRRAEQALRGFTGFPKWMWRNRAFRDFVEQLRAYNLSLPADQRVGVYGMDVYDLYDAIDAVEAYLRRVDRAAFRRARRNYACFSGYNRKALAYAVAAADPKRSCANQAGAVVALVRALAVGSDADSRDQHFNAVQAAESVASAEAYLRTSLGDGDSSPARDRAMTETVEAVADHVQRRSGRPGKVVIWSHNTHSGDARATSAAARGEVNLGQLMKQLHGQRALSVGYFSYAGRVFAAPGWDEPGRVVEMLDALPGSYSHLFQQTGLPAFLLMLDKGTAATTQLAAARLERGIGGIYRPHREPPQTGYFSASLSRQFDAAIFYDRTSAVQPL